MTTGWRQRSKVYRRLFPLHPIHDQLTYSQQGIFKATGCFWFNTLLDILLGYPFVLIKHCKQQQDGITNNNTFTIIKFKSVEKSVSPGSSTVYSLPYFRRKLISCVNEGPGGRQHRGWSQAGRKKGCDSWRDIKQDSSLPQEPLPSPLETSSGDLCLLFTWFPSSAECIFLWFLTLAVTYVFLFHLAH